MRRLVLIGALGALAACSDPPQAQKASEAAKVAPPVLTPGPAVAASSAPALSLDTRQPGADALPGSETTAGDVREAAAEPVSSAPASTLDTTAPPLAQAINQAGPPAEKAAASAGWTVKGVDPSLIRAEVLLDRAGFSPGVIDGKDGQNLKRAAAAYAQARGLGAGGLDQKVWDSLAADTAPAAEGYTITDKDVAGPFIGEPPKDYEELAKLPALSYSTPLQALSEKFHMDQDLLKALNPGADFSRAGTSIVVAVPHMEPRAFVVKRIEVDKSNEAVRAYDASDQLVAYYPPRSARPSAPRRAGPSR